MSTIPTDPECFGIKVPPCIDEDLFRQGFAHSIRGGQLTDIKLHFKKSFGAGFREARLILRDIRKTQGVHEFPRTGKIRFKCNDISRHQKKN